MTYGVLDFPHSVNTDDFVYAVEHMLDQRAKVVPYSSLDFFDVDVLVLFDYIDSEEHLAHHTVLSFLKTGKKLIGIGHGVQTLTEWKLLPGSLCSNASQRLLNKEVLVSAVAADSFVTTALGLDQLQLSISGDKLAWSLNGEYDKLLGNQQVLFRYVEHLKEICDKSPDGLVAGLCDEKKQVYGLLFHPERAVDDEIGNTDGRSIFMSMQRFLELDKNSPRIEA